MDLFHSYWPKVTSSFSSLHKKERGQPQLLAGSQLREATLVTCPTQETPNRALLMESCPSSSYSMWILSNEASAAHCSGLKLGGEEEKIERVLWLKVTEYQVIPSAAEVL